MNALKELLADFPGSPVLHVNGDSHPTALLTVDFGQPTSAVDVPSARMAELAAAMKAAAKEMTKRRGNVKVSHDNRGVYWVGMAS